VTTSLEQLAKRGPGPPRRSPAGSHGADDVLELIVGVERAMGSIGSGPTQELGHRCALPRRSAPHQVIKLRI
jgi:hypothetical protein